MRIFLDVISKISPKLLHLTKNKRVGKRTYPNLVPIKCRQVILEWMFFSPGQLRSKKATNAHVGISYNHLQVFELRELFRVVARTMLVDIHRVVGKRRQGKLFQKLDTLVYTINLNTSSPCISMYLCADAKGTLFGLVINVEDHFFHRVQMNEKLSPN